MWQRMLGKTRWLATQVLRLVNEFDRRPRTRCSVCGSTDVEHAMWVAVNTGEPTDLFGTWNYGDNCWCNDCGEHYPLVDPVDQEDRGRPA
jgi:hypothetical protein